MSNKVVHYLFKIVYLYSSVCVCEGEFECVCVSLCMCVRACVHVSECIVSLGVCMPWYVCEGPMRTLWSFF